MIGAASPQNDTPSMPVPMPTPATFPSPPYQPQDPRSSGNAKPQTSKQPQQPSNDVDDSVVIAVMGATGSGKTTFINAVSGSHMRISGGLRSCTNVVQVAPTFTLDGRAVTLIDTPGFDDTTKSDTEILRMIALFLSSTYEHGKKLAGVIYIHRISDFRMGGISTRNFRMFRELCGDSSLKNVIVLTNMWGQVSKDIGEARERELASDDLFFKPVLDKGAQMIRHDGTLDSATAVIMRLLDNNPMVLQIQREIVDEKKNILQTSAGTELNKELLAEQERHKKVLEELKEEWQTAMDSKDEETRREIEAEAKKVQEAMNRIAEESRTMADKFQREKEALEQRMADREAEAARERQEMQDNFFKQIQDLETQRKRDSDQSREKQEEYSRQIDELRRKSSGGFFSGIGRFLDSIFGS